ncbi:MAG: hypothetical protein IPL35_02995 [Sphingobacteriales bacterium]|nr:hypothetical protein [Sphingobacteriales bacterium]
MTIIKSTFLRWCLALFLAYLPLNNLQAQIDPSDEEYVMEFLQQQYADCLGENTFTNLDELYTFIETNCAPDWGGGDDWEDWGDDDSTWTWTEEDEIAWLSEYYADCLGENTFTNLDELYTFIEANCETNWGGGDDDWDNWGDGDTISGDDWEDWGDDDTAWTWTEEDEIAWLSEYYADCLGENTFTNLDELYTFIETNCQTNWGGGDDWEDWGDDDTAWTWTEEDEIAWLSEYYADCLGENTFTNLDELYTFIETNCQTNWGGGDDWEDWGDDDTAWTWTEEDEIAWLSEYYADCLGENTFTNLDELYTFIETNCQTNWGGGDDWEDWGDDDSTWTWTEEDEIAWLSEYYADCLGENTFTNLDELYTFIETNCQTNWGGGDDWEDWGDDDTAWTWTEEDEIAWLSEYYADCLGENTFTNLDELYTFIETNCAPDWGGGDDWEDWGDDDSTWTWTEEDEIAWLSEYYADCLGENTFTNLDELYTFIETNCQTNWGGGDDWEDWGDDDTIGGNGDDDWEDWGDNDSIWGGGDWEWTVEDELAYLQQIYTDCLTNAPEFESIDAIYDYLEANCEAFNQEYEVEVPECLTDMPELTTFQAFINYLANNCSSEFVAGFSCLLLQKLPNLPPMKNTSPGWAKTVLLKAKEWE